MTFFTHLAGWDHSKRKDGLWAKVEEQTKCLPWTPLLPMPVDEGWLASTMLAAWCCADVWELEGLLRAEVWVVTDGSALLRVKIRNPTHLTHTSCWDMCDDLVPKK